MKQETLEEAAESWVNNRFTKQICGNESYPDIHASKEGIVESHIIFAKWQAERLTEQLIRQQKRMYSEEEVENILFRYAEEEHSWFSCKSEIESFNKWIKQYKKIIMDKEFIPHEQALELKELGFDEPCFGSWEVEKTNIPTYTHSVTKFYKNSDHPTGKTSAPLYQQAFRWFREKYDLVHEISWSKYKGGLNFDYDVFSLVLPTDDELGDEDDIASDKSMETYDSLVDKNFRHHESNTYEEAELACLIKLIEIVKNK